MKKVQINFQNPQVGGYGQEPTNPRMGIYYVVKEINKSQMTDIIDKSISRVLGNLASQAYYDYSDMMTSFFTSIFCKVDSFNRMKVERLRYCLTKTRKKKKTITFINFPSPDVILSHFKKLAVESKVIYNNNIRHEINVNHPLNSLLIKSAKHLNVLKNPTSKVNVVDYDNTIIECKKKDASVTYKTRETKMKGYQPGAAFYNGIPIYIEGRSGNCPAKYKMRETLENIVNLCRDSKLNIDYFRSDGAADQKLVLEFLIKEKIGFVIRKQSNKIYKYYADRIDNWDTLHSVEYEDGTPRKYITEVGSVHCKIYNSLDVQLIIERRRLENGEYSYSYLVTNSHNNMEPAHIVSFYRKRGGNFTEKAIDYIKNDFSWNRLPCSYLKENTVYLILTALTMVLFEYVKRKFSRKIKLILVTWRLKTFYARFILCCGRYNNGNPTIEIGYIDYTPLSG